MRPGREAHGSGLATLIVAVVVATSAFVVYTRTLLPGPDLGDTASFQAAVLWPGHTARDAYPLYYATAAPIVSRVSPGNPARGLNLVSAIWAALAVGLVAWLAAAITRVPAAGVVSGLLLAFSYTFWTQAVIAEVYTLHLALVGGSLVALHAYSRAPTRRRLLVFCAVYALAFGNHLSMILWIVPFALFVLHAHPRPAELLRPGVLLAAASIAAAGALQYLPGAATTWAAMGPGEPWTERTIAIWTDITKADWRETMVLGVHPSALGERVAMWLWDARQQFGIAGLIAAGAGTLALLRLSRPWAVLVGLGYAISALFAITYNVGDVHVFFLPAHYMVALAAGVGAAAPLSALQLRASSRSRYYALAGYAALVLMSAYACWHGYDTWPAASRRGDDRADQLIARIASGLDEQTALLVSGLEWDQANALHYGARYMYPSVSWVPLGDVRLHLHHLLHDTHRSGRDLVLTANAAAAVVAAYDGLFPLLEDASPMARPLAGAAADIAPGTPYVLTALSPLAPYPVPQSDIEGTIQVLTGGRASPPLDARYTVVAGIAGAAPALLQQADRPFRVQVPLLGDRFTIRMDAWVPTDTFRRGGFGHVIRGRERVMFVERGVSLVWFTPDGRPQVAYAGNPYAPQPRFRIPVTRTRFARAPSRE